MGICGPLSLGCYSYRRNIVAMGTFHAARVFPTNAEMFESSFIQQWM